MDREKKQLGDLELYWPVRSKSKEEEAWSYYKNKEDRYFPKEISLLLSKKRSIIQAGGHVGLYPIQYSSFFDKVYTFEPNTLNFSCLRDNTANISNIIIHNVGLGKNNETVFLHTSKKNSGAHFITQESKNEKREETIDIINIDSLNIEDCDLIHLDLEGYELPALQGAINTISKSSPLIVLETTTAMHRYGYSEDDINEFMNSLGYKIFKQWKNDTAYHKH